MAAVAALLLLAVGAAYLRQPAPINESLITIQIPRQTADSVAQTVLAISPNGLRLAYIASTAGGSAQLWVRSIETSETRPLEGTDGVTGVPFWSADSRYLFFTSTDSKLKKIEATGGPAQFLANVATAVVSGFTLADDKIIYAQVGQGLLQLSSKGGDPTPLFEGGSTSNYFPSLMPEGNVIYCSCGGENPGIYVASLDGGTPPRKVLNDASAVVYSQTSDPSLGHILFLRRPNQGGGTPGTLMAQAINPRTLLPSGDPFPIAEQVTNGGFSASTTRRLAYASGSLLVPLGIPGMVHGQLTWLNRDGKVIRTVGDPSIYRIPNLSVDNKLVALETDDPKSQTDVDVQIFEFAGRISTQFTYHERRDVVPLWSWDSKNIVFTRLPLNNTAEIYRKPSDLSSDEELLLKLPTGQVAVANSWSKDERFLLGLTLPAPAEIVALDLQPDLDARKLVTLFTTPGNDINPRFSPDGKWFSYASNETGPYEIYVRPFEVGADGAPMAGSKIQVSKGGAREGGAWWSADSKEIFYVGADGFLTAVNVTTVPTFKTLGPPKALFKMPGGVIFFDVAKDGQSFLMPVPIQSEGTAPPFTVVINWTSNLPK